MTSGDLEKLSWTSSGYGVIIVQSVAASHREEEACVNGVHPDQQDPVLCSVTPVLDIVQRRYDSPRV
ncbi:hypothetical protein PAMA_012024 [Pampus argenteus]